MYVHPSKLAGRSFSLGEDLGLFCSPPAYFDLFVYNDTDFMIESISENTMSNFIEGIYKTSLSLAPFLWSEAFWEVKCLVLHCIITQPVCSVHKHKNNPIIFLKSELLIIKKLNQSGQMTGFGLPAIYGSYSHRDNVDICSSEI